MSWVSGRVMMGEDVHHEESEAGYFKSNDDRSIDPDIALSYIDEKLENVLGHFQKDFEGGVSAENLGAKFGGYGSFLPTYQRSPSIRSQPKSPQRGHANITHTPDHVHREGAAKSFSIPDVTLHERDGNAAARNTYSLYDDKVQLGDDLVKKIFDMPSDQVVEKLPLKQPLSPKKSHNLTGQKSLKFRIKVGSDKSAQKNVAIYSGLGLSSPSTSVGNSPGESGGILVESLVNPDKYPTRILQMLSTLTVALEPLLSPLPDRLMNLLREMPSEGKHDHSAIVGDGYNSKVGDEDFYTGKKSNASRKCEFAKEDAILLLLKENSGAKGLNSRPCGSSDESPNQQLRSTDNDGGSFGNSSTSMNTLKEPEKGNQMKNRKLIINRIKGTLSGAEAVKDTSLRLVSGQGGNKLLHQEARSSSVKKIKDSPVDFPESRRKEVNGITISFNIDSDTFESDRESKGAADRLLQEGGLGATSGERDKLRMPSYKKKFTSESKSKSKISQVYGKISSESVDDGRKASLSANPRQKKGSKMDTSTSRELYEDLFGHSEASDCPVGSLEKPSGDKSKSSNDTVKDECGNSDRLKLKSSQKQVNNQPTSQSLVKDSLKYNVPSTSGLLSEMEHAPKAMEVVQATVPPVLLEDWVECDRCQQWRLLPYGRTEQLPEKWVCSMLDWLPGMNSCDFTEDETTEALHALYQLPLPNSQNSSQYTADRAVTGVSSVDTHCSNLGNSNVNSCNIANGIKKMHKAKETSHKGGKPVVNMTSAPRNLEQGPVMRESLNASDSIDQHHPGSGEAKLKKSSKRVSDQHVRSTVKKIKTGRTSDIISSPTSVRSLGRIEFGSTTSVATVAPLKDMRDADGCPRLKGAESDQGIVLRTRKPKEDMIDTNRGSFDARHSSDSRVSLKKIKLKDHKNSQNNVNAMKDDGHSLPPDNKVPVVENGVTGFRKNKKPTVSQIDGTLVSGTNGDFQVTQKDVRNRMLSSGVQSRKLDKGVDKEKQLRPFKIKVTSQLTMEDLESLKKDLASEPVPAAAATSSSSKVSDSHKTILHYSDNRGSPVESVSSSPVRMLTIGKLLPLKVECLSHDDVKAGDFRTVGSPIKVENGDINWEIQQSGKARPKRTLSAAHPEFLENCGNGRVESNRPCTLEGHDPCLSKEPPSDLYPDKNPSNKRLRTISLHKKNGKVSPMLPKDRERSLNHKEEPERGSPRDRQKLSKPKRSAKVVVEVGLGQAAPSVEELGDVNHQNSTSRSVKSTKASKKHVDEARGNQSKRGQHKNSDANVNNPCAMDASVRSPDFQSGKRKKNLSVVDFGDEKPQVNQHPQDKHDLLSTKVTVVRENRKKDPVLSQPHNFPGRRELSKESKDSRSIIRNSESLHGSSSLGGIASCVPGASVVLKEAEGFRDYADRLKNTGFGYECNETYFQAALKFLHGASLLERPNESSKHGDMNQMQIYINSAKLCETCAEEYERRQEMAAAALAYKCMEAAYLRVVYCKNVTANRLCHDLQASLQLVPQGESPSSSASDIDNLNHLALVEKGSTLSKSNTTHFGNHILASSRSCSSFAQLLDFTKDVNSAMEAMRKSHDALAAANVIHGKAKNTEGILSVKRVIDFSFQDVEELVRLVGFAKEAINRKALRSNRN